MNELSNEFNDTITELNSNYALIIRRMKSDAQRYAQIEAALNAKPDDDAIWLN